MEIKQNKLATNFLILDLYFLLCLTNSEQKSLFSTLWWIANHRPSWTVTEKRNDESMCILLPLIRSSTMLSIRTGWYLQSLLTVDRNTDLHNLHYELWGEKLAYAALEGQETEDPGDRLLAVLWYFHLWNQRLVLIVFKNRVPSSGRRISSPLQMPVCHHRVMYCY